MLTKEMIMTMLENHSMKAKVFGAMSTIIPDTEFNELAHEILSAIQPNSDTPQLNKPEVSEQNEQLPLGFLQWYSGMDQYKILKAYERYKVESGNCH